METRKEARDLISTVDDALTPFIIGLAMLLFTLLGVILLVTMLNFPMNLPVGLRIALLLIFSCFLGTIGLFGLLVLIEGIRGLFVLTRGRSR